MWFISDYYESSSIASSVYTYNTENHPELELLTHASSVYSPIKTDPLHSRNNINSGGSNIQLTESYSSPHTDTEEIINDDSGDESLSDTSSSEEYNIDPTCMVMASSAKAHAGVARYKDFIRSLPVHLSKMVLGFLDTVSLYNCVCVSRVWRPLVEEVHNEAYINQHLQEEVMLMQVMH